MRFFRRDADPPEAATEAFWRWWVEDRDALAAAIGDRTLDRWVDPISRHVHAIDQRLAWELSAGRTAQHALVVTPEGDPAVRPLALDWLAAAPPPDATWEYHAARQAGPLGTLQFGDLVVALEAFRAISSWDEARERVDVRLWHPALAEQPVAARLRAAFLFLDNLLGEEGVERWIGEIDVLDDPTGGKTPDELRAEVERRAATATGESWVLATIQDGRDVAIAVVNPAVKPIEHPRCQHHLRITVARGTEQLAGPGEVETARLDAAEDELTALLASAEPVHLGRITRRRERDIHYMVRDADAARTIAGEWAAAHRDWSPKVEVKADPGWQVRSQLGI